MKEEAEAKGRGSQDEGEREDEEEEEDEMASCAVENLKWGPPGSNLFARRLPDWAEEADLMAVCSPHARVIGCCLLRQRTSGGSSKNVATICTQSPAEALKLMRALRGFVMKMSPSDPRQQSIQSSEGAPKPREILIGPRRRELLPLISATRSDPESLDYLLSVVCKGQDSSQEGKGKE
uniref:Uncharacterized protein n=1 Tax=Chromera velia CCMP2878 TaxID=1169474 RepID=A0A0G4IEG6_9ALVE|eukprot:Cvel_13612.t1-p1 / transcript=Cvel_13612.t1 / gene=Cvel_13612 / organism=Chromera_velia_CCMP2878 / gene_product=hypothetical protein / transcript_product=hypothetical protein / location=Cvel_scaffold937:34360-35341(-) / protein_length=178 / sequence_SO=supercontig / SO=protein_coding / is_pseudo=false